MWITQSLFITQLCERSILSQPCQKRHRALQRKDYILQQNYHVSPRRSYRKSQSVPWGSSLCLSLQGRDKELSSACWQWPFARSLWHLLTGQRSQTLLLSCLLSRPQDMSHTLWTECDSGHSEHENLLQKPKEFKIIEIVNQWAEKNKT